MTGYERREQGRGPGNDGSEGASCPSWSFDDLADLHAGSLADDIAAGIREEVAVDAEAQRLLAALDATQEELRALPPSPMPVDVASRLDAVLAAESESRAAGWSAHAPVVATIEPPPAPPSTPITGTPEPADGPGEQPEGGTSGDREAPRSSVVSLAAARARRSRRMGWGAGVLAAVAVAIGVAVVALPSAQTQTGTPQAIAPPGTDRLSTSPGELTPLTLTSGNLATAVSTAHGASDYGPMHNQTNLDGCLAAVGVPDGGRPLGVRQVVLRDAPAEPGTPGVLVLLPGGRVGAIRILVVGATCTPANPVKLADTRVGG